MLYLLLDNSVLGELIFPPQGSVTVDVETVVSHGEREKELWREMLEASQKNELILVYDKYLPYAPTYYPVKDAEEYSSLLRKASDGCERRLEQVLQKVSERNVLICRGDLRHPSRESRQSVMKLRHGGAELRTGIIYPDPAESWKDDINLAEPTIPSPDEDELTHYPTSGDAIFELGFCTSAPPSEEENDDQDKDSGENDEGAIHIALRSSFAFVFETPWEAMIASVEIYNVYRLR
jgi:hypothetical protein